jgi:hypothetical protein
MRRYDRNSITHEAMKGLFRMRMLAQTVAAGMAGCLVMFLPGCSAESPKDVGTSKTQVEQAADPLIVNDEPATASSQSEGRDVQANKQQGKSEVTEGGLDKEAGPEVTERRGPVTARVSWAEQTGEEREIQVVLEIAAGWHIYAQVPSGSPYPVTSIELDLPETAEAVGEWTKPAGIASLENPGALVFMGTAPFKRTIRLPSESRIGVRITYQACQGTICNPPDSISLTLN